ncbi:unnamed protein product [Lactuca virosa]|uniref:Transposase (putative) gypsy type domain-containing protein n=1 Tax=Lactuca virosa TaxID=75947 RepID=A0AAU9MYE0_9ASTR|nr:unnamed protein product [Lactuca virosa]
MSNEKMARELGIEDLFSTLSQASLERVASQYGLCPLDGVFLPRPTQHMKDPPPDKVGIYVKTMEAGLRFPISKFLEDLFSHYFIHISQLKPNSMFKIVAFELMCKAKKVGPCVPLFRILYRLSSSED